MPVAVAKLMCLRNHQEMEEFNSGPTKEQVPTSSLFIKSNHIKTCTEHFELLTKNCVTAGQPPMASVCITATM